MSIKYRFDDTHIYQCAVRLSCSKDPVSTSSRSIRNYAFTDAERHRSKPRHPLPTPLQFVEVLGCSDVKHYECDNHRCGTSYRSGNYAFVKNAQTYAWSRRSGVRFVNENDSIIQSARLAAGQGFTSSIANYGESLSELTETGKMIHKRASQIAAIANALRSRNFGRLESILKQDLPAEVKRLQKGKELANGWLELEFGWKPLVQDVYVAMEVYRNGIATRGQMVTAPGIKTGYYRPSPTGDSHMNSYSNLEANNLTNRVKSKAYGVVSNPTAFTLNQLGLVNPALLAWQLLPFSFIVDWFLPISQILGVLTNRVGLSQYAICVVSEYNSASQWRCDPVLNNTQKVVTRFVFRSVFTDSVNLSPRSLGLWHAATASALVRQSFGR